MALRFRYMTYEFGHNDIHLRTLRNKQEYSDQDGAAEAVGISSANWSLFGVVWPSAVVLANHMFLYDFEKLRILEVGCGIGLTSLLLNHLNADISAMDYHPEVESFLEANTELNGDSDIPFMQLDWTEEKVGVEGPTTKRM